MRKDLPILASLALASLLPFSVKAEVSPGYLECNGTDRYMLIPNHEVFNVGVKGTRTVSLKVKVNSTNAFGIFENRVRKYDASAETPDLVSGLTLYTTASAVSASANYPSGGWNAYHCSRTTSSIKSSDGWVYLCWVLNESGATLYVQGENDSAISSYTSGRNTTLEMPSYCDLLLGARYAMESNTTFSIDNLSNFLDGAIDDVRIYNEALSAEEVAADRLSADPLSDKTVLAAYNFDDIDGTTVADISGNGHTATLCGESWPSYESANATPQNTVVNVADYNTDGGTVRIVNMSSYGYVTNGAEVEPGTKLGIYVATNQGYQVRKVSVNGVEIEAENGVYYYTTTGKEGTISISVDIVNPDLIQPVVNITAPEEAQGSLVVYNGDEVVTDGTEVAKGTVLTIVATPAFGYKLGTVTVDDVELEANDGVYTYTVESDDITVAASFTALAYSHVNVTTSITNRGVTSLIISDNNGHTGTVAGLGTTSGRSVYVDRTSTVITVNPGSVVSLDVAGTGEWMHTYMFVDYNNDGEFTVDYKNADTYTPSETSELVSYNRYRNYGSTWYNSLGEVQSNGYASIASPGIPTFTIPEDLPTGKYRARYKLDWDSVDPAGSTDSRNYIQNNGGAIIDFAFEVVREARDVVVATSNEQYGSVSIKGVEGNSLTTADDVVVSAVAVGDAEFMCWTDAEGNVVSTDETFTYSAAKAVNLKANFGFEVSLNSEDGGKITVAESVAKAPSNVVNVNDASIANNESKVVLGDKNLVATVVSEDGYKIASVTVNGETTTFNERVHSYEIEFAVDKKYAISAEYKVEETGVEGISVNAADEAEYFNLNGVRVDAACLTPGVYVRRTSTNATKVVIK